MARIFGIVGAVAAVLYHILFDPRQPTAAWSSWGDPKLIVMYSAGGFALGWFVGFAFRKFLREE